MTYLSLAVDNIYKQQDANVIKQSEPVKPVNEMAGYCLTINLQYPLYLKRKYIAFEK